MDYIRDPRYLSLRNFLKDRSLFNMEFLFDTLPNELIPFDYDTFFHSPETMLIGTLDCHTGETKFFSRADYSKMELMEIIKAKPSGAKGQYVRTVTLSTTMGPGLKLDPLAAMALMK